MDITDIKKVIYQFYPKSISVFDSDYNDTIEYKRLRATANTRDPAWGFFLQKLHSFFEYVTDRTDFGPAKQAVVYLYQADYLFEIVIHISSFLPLYSIRIKKAFVDKTNIITKDVYLVWNEQPQEIADEMNIILTELNNHFNYSNIQTELQNLIIEDISANGKGLGETTVFHALFGPEL